jgi:choline monooxygenase
MSVTEGPAAALRGLTDQPETSYTLPSSYYRDPEIFAREREAIFFKSWHYAGHQGDLPEAGCYITCRIIDQDLIVVRGEDGECRAFYNVCQHRGHELVREPGRKKVLICPYHAWSYHLDGRLRTARGAEKLAAFDPDEFCLKPVRLEVFHGFLFVNLDPEARSLAAATGTLSQEIGEDVPRLGEMKRVARRTWQLKANWKVIVENFLECYHCEVAHPALATLLDMKSYRFAMEERHITLRYDSSGRTDSKAYQIGPEDAAQSAVFWWLWPLTTLNVGPGTPNLNVFHFRPLGPELTEEVVEYFFLDDALSDQEKARIAYSDDTLQVEDNTLCEAVQRGLASRGYDRGRFMVDPERSQRSEHATHHFQCMVARALGEAV